MAAQCESPAPAPAPAPAAAPVSLFSGGRLVGVIAALATISIWAGWQLATRRGATTSLAPLDLALLRYGVSSILLAPVLLRCGPLPCGADRRAIAAMVLGAGLPFGLLAMAGAQFAPVAHMGAIIPTTMPVFVAALGAIWFGERLSMLRLVGFSLIVAGLVAIIAPSLGEAAGSWRGDILFVACGALWAIYTFGVRASGLNGWQSAAVLNVWSFVFVVPIWFAFGMGRLLSAPPGDIALQVLWQGVLSGVVGLATYALAVRRLGAAHASAFAALVPGLAAFGGFTFLGEPLTTPVLVALVLVTAGFLFASGAVGSLVRAGRSSG